MPELESVIDEIRQVKNKYNIFALHHHSLQRKVE